MSPIICNCLLSVASSVHLPFLSFNSFLPSLDQGPPLEPSMTLLPREVGRTSRLSIKFFPIHGCSQAHWAFSTIRLFDPQRKVSARGIEDPTREARFEELTNCSRSHLRHSDPECGSWLSHSEFSGRNLVRKYSTGRRFRIRSPVKQRPTIPLI